MKVAFATTRGTTVDEHFGRAGKFAVYDVRPDGYDFIELRHVAEGDLDIEVIETRGLGAVHDDAVAAKADRLADCRIVYFTEIGGPSAAKLVQRGIMPIKVAEGDAIASAIDALVTTMASHPAPWMRKALAAEDAPHAPAGSCGCGACE